MYNDHNMTMVYKNDSIHNNYHKNEKVSSIAEKIFSNRLKRKSEDELEKSFTIIDFRILNSILIST